MATLPTLEDQQLCRREQEAVNGTAIPYKTSKHKKIVKNTPKGEDSTLDGN